MVLVVLAPLVSRALAHPPAAAVPPPPATATHAPAAKAAVTHAHPSMHHDPAHGSEHPLMPPAEHGDATPDVADPTKPSDRHAQHDMGVDCDYCVIAARMVSLLVALLLLMGFAPVTFRALAGPVHTRQSPSRGTLGARGPPHALAG